MRRPARYAGPVVLLVLALSGTVSAAAPSSYAAQPSQPSQPTQPMEPMEPTQLPQSTRHTEPPLPPVGTDFDYQLGGNRTVPGRVGIVVRDREAPPADGRYNVCYVNGFQTQENEKHFWRTKHWDLVLKDGEGHAVVDEGWGEWLLDLRTPEQRRTLARIVGRWVDRCAEDGFAGVEYDNLDSYSRSHGLISRAQTKQYAAALVRRAHRSGLGAAQKNMAQWDGSTVGFDFAIAEECSHWHECGRYVDHYGRHVLAVEYTRRDFKRACSTVADQIAVVRRDVALSRHGVRRWC